MEQEQNGLSPDGKETTAPESEKATGIEPAGGRPEDGGSRAAEAETEQVQKRTKRESRKQLLEHLQRKNAQLLALDQEVKNLAQQIRNKDDRILRLAAEFENYRKRTAREWDLLQKRANAELIREILSGIDNFDLAFASLDGAEAAFYEGLKLIHASLMDILKKAGMVEMDVLGAKFDPQYHEAVGEIDGGEVEEGRIAQVVRKGYLLHGETLRPARVMVARKKS